MAIVQNPITGRSRNKFGTAVFSKQYGKNTMRAKPLDVNQKVKKKTMSLIKFKAGADAASVVL